MEIYIDRLYAHWAYRYLSGGEDGRSLRGVVYEGGAMTASNNRRAREGNAALQAYWLDATDTDLHFVPELDAQTAFVYLVAALRHLCDAQRWDFGELDKSAYRALQEQGLSSPWSFSTRRCSRPSPLSAASREAISSASAAPWPKHDTNALAILGSRHGWEGSTSGSTVRWS